jgi:hypothetical protein
MEAGHFEHVEGGELGESSELERETEPLQVHQHNKSKVGTVYIPL